MGFIPSVAWYQHRCLLEEGTDERNYNSQSQSAVPTCDLHSPHHCCTANGFIQLLQKRLVARPDKRHNFLKTQRFTAIFIRGRNLKLTCSSWIPSTSQTLDLSKTVHVTAAEHYLSQLYPIYYHAFKSPDLLISKAHSLSQLYPIHTPTPYKLARKVHVQQHTAAASCIQSTITPYKLPRTVHLRRTLFQPALAET
jgi:hypothetical protein